MSGITDPAEEYFKDGIWGWTGALWQKLLSSGGRLFTALHGWDGSAWRKLPIVWGYSDRYAEQKGETNAAAGVDELTLSVVPAGEVWYIQGVCATDVNTNVNFILIRHYGSGAGIYLHKGYPTAAYMPVEYHNPVLLKEDDYISVAFSGTALNDDIYAWAWGYKMKVAE